MCKGNPISFYLGPKCRGGVGGTFLYSDLVKAVEGGGEDFQDFQDFQEFSRGEVMLKMWIVGSYRIFRIFRIFRSFPEEPIFYL